MVVPRKWKLVAGAMSATVALGASAAVAQEGDESADENSKSVLTEVIDIETLAQVDDTETTLVQNDVLIEDESPFDSVAEESTSLESEESTSVESEDSTSLESEESTSVESEDSTSLESEESTSVESEDSTSVESESVASADSISIDSTD